MKIESVYRLVYVSNVSAKIINDSILNEFRNILKVSQYNNKKNQMTGFLVFDSVNFVQILEGSRDTIWKLFQKILTDGRHYNINLIEFSDCEQRQFADWSMGGCLRTVMTDHVFIRYGFFGPIEASELKPENLIALAHDLMVANRLGPSA